MYPKNTWYVACTPDEIATKPLGRQICGEKIVFYRAQVETAWPPWRTSARTVVRRCRVTLKTATWRVVTTAW